MIETRKTSFVFLELKREGVVLVDFGSCKFEESYAKISLHPFYEIQSMVVIV